MQQGRPQAATGFFENGRDGEIRTLGLYNPNVALYQAKLRPDISFSPSLSSGRRREARAFWGCKQILRRTARAVSYELPARSYEQRSVAHGLGAWS